MQLQKLDFVSPGAAQVAGDVVVSAPAPAPTPTPVTVATASSDPAPHEVHAAVVQANRAVRALAATLEFEVDPDTDTIVIRLVDNSDHTVLRQVPTEEMLNIAKSIDRLQGLLLRQQA